MEDQKQQFTVDVWLDAKTFQHFSIFNSITKDRRWVRPAVFAAVFCALAIICFVFQSQATQAVLLGVVLLIVGLGLPLVYFGTYFMTLRRRTEELKLKNKKQHAYCVTLASGKDGIHVTTPKGDEKCFQWKESIGAYRVNEAIYLYVEPGRVYILPNEYTGEQMEDIWGLIKEQMPKNTVKVVK